MPRLGNFFVPLRLLDAFREYDAVFALSRRRYIPPNFAELRHVVNIAQVRSLLQLLLQLLLRLLLRRLLLQLLLQLLLELLLQLPLLQHLLVLNPRADPCLFRCMHQRRLSSSSRSTLTVGTSLPPQSLPCLLGWRACK